MFCSYGDRQCPSRLAELERQRTTASRAGALTQLAALHLLLVLAAPASAQVGALGPVDGRALPAVDTGRVKVRDLAPDFTLESLVGDRVTLSQFRGKKVVLLQFYRGHW